MVDSPAIHIPGFPYFKNFIKAIDHLDDEAYWNKSEIPYDFHQFDVPMFHVTGWYDSVRSETICNEGFMLANYGTLGKTYNIVDGEPVYTDLIWNNDQGSATDMLSAYAAPAQWPAFERVFGRDTDEAAQANFRVWESNADNLYEMPGDMTLNSDEIDTYSSVFPEIKSYVEEMTVKFIMGLEPLDPRGILGAYAF